MTYGTYSPNSYSAAFRAQDFRVSALITLLMLAAVVPIILLQVPPSKSWYVWIILGGVSTSCVWAYRSGGLSPSKNFYLIVLPSLLFAFATNMIISAPLMKFVFLYIFATVFAIYLSGYIYGIITAGLAIILEFMSMGVNDWNILYLHLVVLSITTILVAYFSARQSLLQNQVEAINDIALALHQQEAPADVLQVIVDKVVELTQSSRMYICAEGMDEPYIVATGRRASLEGSQPDNEESTVQLITHIAEKKFTITMIRPNLVSSNMIRDLNKHIEIALARAYNRDAEHEERQHYNHALEEANLNTLNALIDMLEERDPYTAGHSRRVASIAAGLATRLGLDGDAIHVIRIAGVLHDIGKIALPDSILHKTGPLVEAEWAEVKRHPATGAAILSRIPSLQQFVLTVLSHHERWDGQGYPKGLKGAQIPLSARILAAADALDAITSNRAYRAGRTLPEACIILRHGAGSQWDPHVATTLVDMMGTTTLAAVLRPAPGFDHVETIV